MKKEIYLNELSNDFLVNDLIDLDINLSSDKNEEYLHKLIFSYLNNNILSDKNRDLLRYDYETKLLLLNYIQQKIRSLVSDKSKTSIKDLDILVSLLSLGEKYTISYTSKFDILQNFKNLFIDYENLLKELIKEEKQYNVTFNMYTTLLDILYEYCIKLSKDISTRVIIPSFLQLISESINTLRFYHQIDDKKRRKLNYLQGRMLFEFANINYIVIEGISLKKLIYIYENIMNQIIDGYFMITSILKTPKIELQFLEKITHTILLLLYKLKSFQDFDFDALQKIQYLYRVNTKVNTKEYQFLEDFRSDLLNNYSILYDKQKIYNKDELLNKIIEHKDIPSKYLVIFHDLLLFSDFNDVILNEQLESIIILIESFVEKENLMLVKILNMIIKKHLEYNIYSIEEQIQRVLFCLSKRSIKNTYKDDSFLYLTISYYYALKGKGFISNSQKLYQACEKRHFYLFLDVNSKEIFQNILSLHSKTHFETMRINENFSQKEYIFIGNSMMKNFFLFDELSKKNNIENKTIFIEKKLNTKKIKLENLKNEFLLYLQKELFFNLVSLDITNESQIKEISNEYEVIELNKYSLYIKRLKKDLGSKLDKLYIKDKIEQLFICYLLNEDQPKEYNNYLQVDEYIKIV